MIKNSKPKFIKHILWKNIGFMITGFFFSHDKDINLMGYWINLQDHGFKKSFKTNLKYSTAQLLGYFFQFNGSENELNNKSKWEPLTYE